jgi:DNA-binding FadR family transcriptional regulator
MMRVHQAITRDTHGLLNNILLNFFNQFFCRDISLYIEDEGTMERTRRFHRELFEAIRNQEPREVRRIRRSGLLYAEESIREMLEGMS